MEEASHSAERTGRLLSSQTLAPIAPKMAIEAGEAFSVNVFLLPLHHFRHFFLPFDLLPFWKLHLTSHLDWYPRRRDLTRSLCAHVKDDCYQPSSPRPLISPLPSVCLPTTFHFHLILQLNLVLSSSSVRSSLDGVSAAECAPETLLPPPPHVFPPLLTSSERKELEGEREKSL